MDKCTHEVRKQYWKNIINQCLQRPEGMTAKQWRDSHPDLKGNIRDYANVSQLVCLSNLENLNAVFINEGISQSERLAKLNAIAISQMKVLTEDHRILQLEAAEETEKPQ